MILHDIMSQRTVHNSWKMKMSQFFNGLLYSPYMSPIEHIRIEVYDSVFQFTPVSSNFAQPLKRSGTTFHRPQSTA
jgi:hypothetical protein